MKLILLNFISIISLALPMPLMALGERPDGIESFRGTYQSNGKTAVFTADRWTIDFIFNDGTVAFHLDPNRYLGEGVVTEGDPDRIIETEAESSRDTLMKIVTVTRGWDRTKVTQRFVNYGPKILFQEETIQYRWNPIFGWWSRTTAVGKYSTAREFTKISDKSDCGLEL